MRLERGKSRVGPDPPQLQFGFQAWAGTVWLDWNSQVLKAGSLSLTMPGRMLLEGTSRKLSFATSRKFPAIPANVNTKIGAEMSNLGVVPPLGLFTVGPANL